MAPKKKGGCLKWLLLLMGGGFLMCCCFSLAVLDGLADAGGSFSPPSIPAGEATSLGTALVPSTLNESAARHWRWRESRRAWDVGYGLSSSRHDDIDEAFERLSVRFAYRPGAGTNFTWRPPPECQGREWQCVFETLAADNADAIAPLSQLFEQVRRERSLDDRELTDLVVSFVQNITYKLPTGAFGMLPPAAVLSDGNGDCDSKALLAVVMLRQLGIDAVILLGSAVGHAALGVGLPSTGTRFSYGGRRYAYVEVTAPGWVTGSIPPEYNVLSAWKVIPVAVP